MLVYKAQWTKEIELRELRDQVKWYEGEGRNSGCMADKLVERSLLKRTNKLQRKKELVTQMRKSDVSTDMLVKVVDEHKEKWRQELQDIEPRRTKKLAGKNEDNGFGSQKLAGWRWEAR